MERRLPFPILLILELHWNIILSEALWKKCQSLEGKLATNLKGEFFFDEEWYMELGHGLSWHFYLNTRCRTLYGRCVPRKIEYNLIIELLDEIIHFLGSKKSFLLSTMTIALLLKVLEVPYSTFTEVQDAVLILRIHKEQYWELEEQLELFKWFSWTIIKTKNFTEGHSGGNIPVRSDVILPLQQYVKK